MICLTKRELRKYEWTLYDLEKEEGSSLWLPTDPNPPHCCHMPGAGLRKVSMATWGQLCCNLYHLSWR